jgi:hypothetical protein
MVEVLANAKARLRDVRHLGSKHWLYAPSNRTHSRTKLGLSLRVHVLLIHFTEKRCDARSEIARNCYRRARSAE